MKIAAFIGTVFLVAACTPEPETLAPSPIKQMGPYSIGVASNARDSDRATLNEIIDATLRVITSKPFAHHLAEVQQKPLYLSPGGDTLSASVVSAIYTGQNTSYQPVQTVARITRTWFSGAPITGLFAGSPTTARITLTTYELERWRTGTPNGRSCAVNTLAHEITHTIPKTAGSGYYLFADRGRKDEPKQALVSYVVGSVAQCTMLENEGALGGSFPACVEKWGTNGFNSGDCS